MKQVVIKKRWLILSVLILIIAITIIIAVINNNENATIEKTIEKGQVQQDIDNKPPNNEREQNPPEQRPKNDSEFQNESSKDTNRYLDNDDGTVTDIQTGLMWQLEEEYDVSLEQAKQAVVDLDLGGYGDWRIPTMIDLLTIVDENLNHPPFNSALGISESEYFWSCDIESDNNSKVWVINAGGGCGDKNPKESHSAGGEKIYSLKCVRNNLETPDIRYVNNGDGTITDNFLMLIWQQIPSDKMTLEAAKKYAENLNLGGYSDWRLPTMTELAMFCSYSYDNPVVNKDCFLSIDEGMFWTDSVLAGANDKQWFVNLSCGRSSYENPNSEFFVLCVKD